jgi:mxaC protein
LTAIAFETPWFLAGLLLTLLPLFKTGIKPVAYSWLVMLPPDPLSVFFSGGLRLIGMATVAALILGLSGIYLKEQQIERVGHGAHIVMLLDRSISMDTTFAGKAPNGAEESKSVAAKRLLSRFVDKRQQDRIGIAAYSTSPMFIMPLTENKQAIQSAISAMSAPALAYTNISKGLAMALSFFERQPITGARVLLLVSDGAAAIDPESELELRKLFKESQVRLYWIFMRTQNSPGLFTVPDNSRDDNADAMPERYLNLFFSSLNIPYQAYEAESPKAMQQAIHDIDQLENRSLQYFEHIPKRDLTDVCYRWATAMLVLLFVLKFLEVRIR